METLLQRIEQHAQAHPDHIALVEGDIIVTYAQLGQSSLKDYLQGLTLYTTGSTGNPKAVFCSNERIAANTENLVLTQGFTEDTIFVNSGPISHMASLSKLWATFWAGGMAVQLDGIKDMNAFFQAFEAPIIAKRPSQKKLRFATFLVPSAIRMLMRFAPQQLAALSDRMDFLETGAAAMTQADLEWLCHYLPDTRLYNTYGSTETGIQCTHDFNHDGCHAGLLGKPMKHSHVEITPEGLVRCTGPCVVDGEYTTKDLGKIDEQGRLWLTGRVDDILNICGFKINPVEVEEAALRCPGVDDCLCRAIEHPILGKELQLQYASCQQIQPVQVAKFMTTVLPKEKIPTNYKLVDRIPRTATNGKLIRH